MKRNPLLFGFVFIIVLWSLCYKLDYQPMYLWDESRQANNALEMAGTGNYFYPTYENQPDFWNTKPHLVVAFQAILFKVFGPSLTALRLPSAFAAACALLLWFQFFWRRKYYNAAWIFLIIMLSNRGFNTYHVARTGDYDAFLLLFLTVCILSLYRILFEKKENTSIGYFALGMTLAVLTKSMAGLLWLPIFVVAILIFSDTPFKVFKKLILPGIMGLTVVLSYYLFREWHNPGYLIQVWENEVMARYIHLPPNEGHESHWYYYFYELHNKLFEGFIYFLIPLIYIFVITKYIRRDMVYFMVLVIIFFVIISLSATRISWYLAPALPLLTGIIALGLSEFLARTGAHGILAKVITAALLITAFWQHNLLWKENLNLEGINMQLVLQRAEKKGSMPYQGIWLWENYCPIERYYAEVFRRKQIEFKYSNQFEFQQRDTVYTYHYHYTDSLHKHYECRQIHAPDAEIPMWVFVIDARKSTENKLKNF